MLVVDHLQAVFDHAQKIVRIDQVGRRRLRRVAVMGDMLELGPGAPAAHREVGAHAASLDIDAVFALGSHAAETAEGAISAGFPAGASHAFEARDRLTEALQAFVKPGDLLLLKGSRGLAMESVGQALGFEM